MTSKELEALLDKVNQVNNAGYEKVSYIVIPEEIYDKVVKKEEVSPQNTPAIKKIDKVTYKEIISEEELKTYKGTLEWKDNKKYLILYGTGSYSIVTGSKVDTDEEIIESYRQSLNIK